MISNNDVRNAILQTMHNSVKGGLKVIDYIVLGSECWRPNGTRQ